MSVRDSGNTQVKSRERVERFGEVITAQREVEAMCDLLPDEMFERDKTFLEPACGNGVFLLEVLRRKFSRCKKRKDYSDALASVWGMDIQQDNVDETIENILGLCRRYFQPTKTDIETIGSHVIMCDSLKVMGLIAQTEDKNEQGVVRI